MKSVDLITQCPVCHDALTVTKLSCNGCGTKIENDFNLPKLLQLSKSQLHFVEVFMKCRGNIKEVEKELNISYPTVRSKLDEVVNALGHHTPKKESTTSINSILDLVEEGALTPSEAIKQIEKERL